MAPTVWPLSTSNAYANPRVLLEVFISEAERGCCAKLPHQISYRNSTGAAGSARAEESLLTASSLKNNPYSLHGAHYL